jgi:hypothetical protein
MQLAPVGQGAAPQPPQLLGSVLMLVQTPSQQSVSEEHLLPQPPQLFGSTSLYLHVPPQLSWSALLQQMEGPPDCRSGLHTWLPEQHAPLQQPRSVGQQVGPQA